MDVDWALARLRPPTRHDLQLAHRVGVNPNDLIEAFTRQYDAAAAEDSATTTDLAGACEDTDYDEQLWWSLQDHITAICDEHRQEWWNDPQLAVAEILNPAITANDREQLATMLRCSRTVGLLVSFDRGRRAARPVASAGRARPRGLRSTARRRTSASSSTSSSDPGSGDGSSDEPPPAPVVPTLAPPPRAILTYGFAPEVDR